MTKTISNLVVTSGVGPIKMVTADVNITSYTENGEEVTPADMKMKKFLAIAVEPFENYGYDSHFDYENSKVRCVEPTSAGTPAFTGTPFTGTFTGTVITPEDITIADLDAAASTGVAVYLHTKDGRTGWFEFVSPTNVDGTYTLANGGSAGFIIDSDNAATDGVVIYLDEDAANADERLLCISPSASDIYIPVPGSDQVIKIVHDASAASNGVQVYFDEDASNSYEKMMFVSPTDTEGTGATDDTYYGLPGVPTGALAEETPAGTNSSHTAGVGTEVTAATDVGVFKVVAFGV